MKHNKAFAETVKKIAETLTHPQEEEIEAMISVRNFMNATEGTEMGRAISEGFADGLGVKFGGATNENE